jgi:hypothetical protein
VTLLEVRLAVQPVQQGMPLGPQAMRPVPLEKLLGMRPQERPALRVMQPVLLEGRLVEQQELLALQVTLAERRLVELPAA